MGAATWYSDFLEEARKKGDRRLVRILLRMGRRSNLSTKSRNQFLVRYSLAKNPEGLTVKQLQYKVHKFTDGIERRSLSREAIYRALKVLLRDGLVIRKLEKRDTDAHVFPRSFAVYRLTKKGREGIVLPSPSTKTDKSFSGPYMLEKDKYRHWRRAR